VAALPTRSHSIAGLFGGFDVVAHELVGAPEAQLLLDVERDTLRNAGLGRREQFAAGRACARAGLSLLGCPEEPLLVGDDRRPLWPAGVTGSISHTKGVGTPGSPALGFGVAVVALDGALSGWGIGVDVERIGRVREALFGRLFTVAELEDLRRLPVDRRALHATLLFSAKEAFYKAQFGFSRSWVGFRDVEIGTVEIGTVEIGTVEIGTVEIGTVEIGTVEIGTVEIGTVEMRAGERGLLAKPVTELAALSLVRWPVSIGFEVRSDLVITGVVVEPVEGLDTLTVSEASAPR
jgi:phosphopantetheine--protein transferase-like protein